MSARSRIGLPELKPYLRENVQFLNTTDLGKGAYGKVVEVKIAGATAAGKKIHAELIEFGSPQQVDKWVGDFLKECNLMSRLRHPNIVQFLGICYRPDSELPVLLMEKLQTNLHILLEDTPDIPTEIKVHILTGIACGLLCLHSESPPIAHRDLTAKNVLIDSNCNAKLSDLGVSRMVTIQPGKLAATMTGGPGNDLYMPPEAKTQEPSAKYNVSIDIFSFGVTSLFTLSQVFPKDLKPHNFKDPDTKKLIPRTEIERREEYVSLMEAVQGKDNPLVKLTLDCLEHFPEDRPSAEAVLRRLEGIGETLPKEQSKLELVREIEKLQMQLRNDGTGYQPQARKSDQAIPVRAPPTVLPSSKPVFAGKETTVDIRSLSADSTIRFSLLSEVKNSLVAVKRGDGNRYALTLKPPHRGRHELRIASDQGVKTFPIAVAPDPAKLDAPSKVIEGLNGLMGAAVNSRKEFIVTENGTIEIFDREWVKLPKRSFGKVGTGDGEFNCPDGIAVDSHDNMYIVDTGNHRVQKFSPEGEFLSAVGSEGNGQLEFSSPTGIAYNKMNGLLYISDQDNNRVQILKTDLTFHSSFGQKGDGNGEFDEPDGLYCDENGSVFVTDSGNDRVQVFTAHGGFSHSFGSRGDGPSEMKTPAGVAVSASVVYVCEYRGHRVSMFTVSGEFVGSFGKFGAGLGQFKNPTDVLIDDEQNIIVVDFGSRIQLF